MKFIGHKIVGLLLLVFGVTTGLAAEIEYELHIGGIYTDNVEKTEFGEEEDVVAQAGLVLDLSSDTRLTDFTLLSNLNFNHYTDSSFSDEVVGALNADLGIDVVQNIVQWVTTNRFGTLQTNPFASDNPNNRGNFNRFSTGPDIGLPLGGRTTLNLGAQYNNTYYEERDNDNEVIAGSIGFSRALSTRRSVSIAASYDDISFDNTDVNTDYERASAFLSFQSEVSKGTVSVSLGVNEVDIEGETLDGTLAQVALSRQLSSRTSFRFSYDQRYSSAGDIFSLTQGTPGRDFGDTQDVPGDGEPFENRSFSASLSYNYANNEFFIRAGTNEEDYESDNAQERQRTSMTIGFSRRLGSKWRVSADGRFARLDYKNVDREDDDSFARVGLSRQLTRTLHLDFDYRYSDRSSDNDGFSYTENRYGLSVRFIPE